MQKTFIKNRKGLKIVVLVQKHPHQKGLVFVMHGLGGYKEQTHIETFAQTFVDKGFTVIRFDTTNTIGESDGKYENATTTNYYQDLEDVIGWAKKQNWYQVPFWLVGHSLGGICTALYAENHPEEIKALAPISTVVTGKLSLEAPKHKDTWKNWQRTGWKITLSSSKPNVVKKLKWSHMEDRLKYDLLAKGNNLTMPVLLIAGSNDDATPPKHQKILFDKLPGKKELHIIKNAPHTFIAANQLAEIKNIFSRWIDKNI